MTLEPTGTLDDLAPSVRGHFEQLLELADELGMEPHIRSAGRTCADQEALAAQGPSTTRARGCRSWHVLGRAIDLDLTPNVCETYTQLGLAWEQMGGGWGGRWTQFGTCGDAGHYQWPFEGEPRGGAVPSSVCREDVDCETVRSLVFERERERPLLKLVGFAALGLGAYLLWKAI